MVGEGSRITVTVVNKNNNSLVLYFDTPGAAFPIKKDINLDYNQLDCLFNLGDN